MDDKKNFKYNIHSTRLIKHEKKLDYIKSSQKLLFEEFVKKLEPNQVVDVFFEAYDETGSNNQIRKIHACIREMAIEMGDTFVGMKQTIKEMSGLKFPLRGEKDYEKSFAVCSSRELSLVIQTIITAGDELNINFRGAFPQYYQEDL